jgi:GT2 family glycosyltransferase
MSLDRIDVGHEDDNRITLCVATRNRPELVERYLLPCVRRLPAGSGVIVVDQSTTGRTAERLEGGDGIVYRRTNEVGLSRARNLAVRVTRAPLLAFTDDDVSFEPSWLDQLVVLFDGHPEAGAVCGRAVTPSGQPVFGSARRPGVYGWPTSPFGLGWGLNIAFRREALLAAGPFDEELGAGALFRSGEDTDMLYRVMRAGWSVVCSDEVVVVHHDWRSRREELRLRYAYGIGAGAQTAKHLSAGDRDAGWMALRLQLHLPRTILLLRPRYGLRHLLFSAGMAAGFIGWRRAHKRPGRTLPPADETTVADRSH